MPAAPVLDAYVPAGASTFRVRGASAFHPGDRVLVLRPVTAEWIHFMGMDTLVRDASQTWIRAGSVIRTDRVVESVEGDRVTLDVPLSDALDSQFTAASLVRYSFPGRITEVGVEGLRIAAPFEDVPITEPQYTALLMDAVEDGWARDLEIRGDAEWNRDRSGAKRLTLTNVRITHSAAHSGSAAPADFALQGTQILLDRCRVTGEGTWPVVTQSEVTGPLVVLNFTADHGGVAPHQRWATGLAGGWRQIPGRDRAQAGPGLLQPRHGGIGPRLGYRLGGGVERQLTLSAGAAAARCHELVHRLHWHAGHNRRYTQWHFRFTGKNGGAGQPLSPPATRPDRAGCGAEYRVLVRVGQAGSLRRDGIPPVSCLHGSNHSTPRATYSIPTTIECGPVKPGAPPMFLSLA